MTSQQLSERKEKEKDQGPLCQERCIPTWSQGPEGVRQGPCGGRGQHAQSTAQNNCCRPAFPLPGLSLLQPQSGQPSGTELELLPWHLTTQAPEFSEGCTWEHCLPTAPVIWAESTSSLGCRSQGPSARPCTSCRRTW